MSWRFRKTFKVLPGVKLNLTARGLSATLGAAPFSINIGPKGVYRNVSIPGTGIWTGSVLAGLRSHLVSNCRPQIAPSFTPFRLFRPQSRSRSHVAPKYIAQVRNYSPVRVWKICDACSRIPTTSVLNSRRRFQAPHLNRTLPQGDTKSGNMAFS